MAFKTITDLSADVTISLGGFNKKTRKDNPLSIEGYYLGKRAVPNVKTSGESNIYYFQTKTGNVGVWGKTDLDRKMSTVALGTMTRASFDKMVPTTKGEMYKFKVEVDADNTIEVATTETTPAQATGFNADEGIDETDSDEAEDTYEAEETKQKASLNALERQAKVNALLNGNKRN